MPQNDNDWRYTVSGQAFIAIQNEMYDNVYQMQGSHSVTDKKNPGLFQDFPVLPWEIFQDLFAAHGCSNIKNNKVQQSWQTSALAMHLPLARLISMPVMFCLLPSSSIVILVIFYLFSTGISEQHVWELWVWIQSWVHLLDASSSGNPNELDLVCRKRTVSNSRPACRKAFLKFVALFVFTRDSRPMPMMYHVYATAIR